MKVMNITDRNRIIEYLSKMTLEEKLNQLDEDFADVDWEKIPEPDRSYCKEHLKRRRGDAHTYNILQSYAMNHTRLKIPYLIHEEALHGLHRPDATILPQQITLASTFDRSLARKMGEVIASESRAKGIHEVWAPVLDLAREPRWGRTEETLGEDTYLSAKMGAEIVRGLQGETEQELKSDQHVLSELKHFTAYGNPVGGLNCAPAAMGRHDVFSYCMPVFEEAIVKAGAFNVMASYNSIDAVPVISDREILTETLRGKWGMPGLVRSDMTAIIMQHTAHYTAASPKEALKNSVKAGVDVQLYDYSHDDYRSLMKELLDEGSITIEEIDQSVMRVLTCKLAAGLFENPFVDEELEKRVVHCQQHKETALEIARKGAVLLKNQDRVLPLPKKGGRIAVLGPNANIAVMGDYCTEPDYSTIGLYEAISSLLPDREVVTAKGCNILGAEIKPVERWWIRAEARPEFHISENDYGFTAEYFNGPDFTGVPVLTRLDPQINFNWIFQKPDDIVDTNCFSVRWSGKIRMEKTFEGRLGLSSLDSMRLYLNGELIIDGWEEKDANQMVEYRLESEKEYAVVVEFRNDARAPRVIFGYDYGMETIEEAVALARDSEVAIVALGDSAQTSGENFDRTSLDLPGEQLAFLKAIYETNTPVILVLYTGRPVSCCWEKEHIHAILQAGFGGELGAQAVAEILFGEVNPSGRLPISYPKTVGQIPCHYSRKPAGGRKYVEMDWNPLFPFGFGLSYTTFTYSNLTLSQKELSTGDELTISVEIANTGSCDGEEVAQLYVRDCYTSVVRPLLELKGFERVSLKAGEGKMVVFHLGEEELRLLNKDYEWVVEKGEFEVMVGKNSEEILLRDHFFVI